jgi:hypothetical protein
MEKPNKSDKAASSGEGFPKRPELAGSRRRSLRLKISGDGTPEFSALSREQKDNWKEVFSHPETSKALGLEPKQAPPTLEIPKLGAQETGMLWEIIMALTAWGVAGFYKAPRALAVECFSLDETDKAILIPPTQELISKYAPELMLKYSAEASLLLALGFVMKEKTGILKARLAELAKQPPAEQPAKLPKTANFPAIHTNAKGDGEVASPAQVSFDLRQEEDRL